MSIIIRKAKQAVLADERKAKSVVVMDSLPFGGDEADTLPLAPKELDLIAEAFDEEEPEIPDTTPIAPSQRLVYLRSFETYILLKKKKTFLFSCSYCLAELAGGVL